MTDYVYRGNQPWTPGAKEPSTPPPAKKPEKRRPVKKRKPPRILEPCPSRQAYRRHRAKGEPICDGCREENGRASREQYKAKVEAAGRIYTPKNQPKQCGTRSGYYAHLKNGDPKCDPCWAAMAAHNKANRLKRESKEASHDM